MFMTPTREIKSYEKIRIKENDPKFLTKICVIGLKANGSTRKDKDGKHPPCGTSGKKRGYAKCVPKKPQCKWKRTRKKNQLEKRETQNKADKKERFRLGQGKKPINAALTQNEVVKVEQEKDHERRME